MTTRARNISCILMVAGIAFGGGACADGTVRGRFVRVAIPGEGRYLALAEVQIFSGGVNVALAGSASQSSDYHGAAAARAIDGNTSGNFKDRTITHTEQSANPWWEVDLGAEKEITKIAVWNRTGFESRLDGCRIQVLDAARAEQWRAEVPTAGIRVEMATSDYPVGSGKRVEYTAPPVMETREKAAPKDVETINVKELPTGLQAVGAKQLLDAGVEELVFVKRFTLNANHVYTEYVNSAWTPGGNLCILNLKTGKVRELVPALTGGVFNRFDVSFDAQKVLFDYKKADVEGYRIYEVQLDGAGLRQLTFPEADEQELIQKYRLKGYHHGTDDLHPCYLPDGGIVFATTRCRYSVLCDASDTYTTKNLWRMDADGKNMQPLSNSSVSEASPVIMPDGRILYHRWEYVDKASGNLKSLWAMKPDGTASVEIYGNTISQPETMIYARPVPGADNRIVMLGSTHWGPNNALGTVIVVDTRKNIRSRDAMTFITKDVNALGHAGFYFRDEKGEWKLDTTGIPGRLFKDPYPVSESLFIVAHKPKGLKWDNPVGYDLSLLDENGADTLLYRDPAISCWHPFPLAPRRKPPVPASSPDPELAEQNLAGCIVTDIYEGMDHVERGSIKYIRVMEQVPRPWTAHQSWFPDDKDGMAHTAVGLGLLGLKVQHGIVPVEEDGSAYFTVPADRNIYFQALDKNHMAVQTERTYVNYRPGEVRGCVGCHELPSTVPASRRRSVVQALRREPSVPQPQPGEPSARKVFDYPRQIQPIWDAHCLPCHSGENPKAKLNLSGEPTTLYSVSYESLVKRPKRKMPLVGERQLLNENVGSAGIEYLPPYAVGSTTSLLLAIHAPGRVPLKDAATAAWVEPLIAKHADIKLTEEELLKIANWIDANCPFYPSYWGRKNARFADHPDFRPDVTFAEAISRTVPASVAAAEAQQKN